MRRTRMVAVTAGVVLMAGLTACGSDTSEEGDGGSSSSSDASQAASPLAELRKASAQTEQKESARVEGTTTQNVPQGKVKSEMRGAMDWGGEGMSSSVTIRQEGDTAAAKLAGTGEGWPTRYTPDAMYMNLGEAFAEQAGGGRQWVRYGYDELAERSGAAGAFLQDQVRNNDPARSVDLVLASGKVRKVGTEKVRGQEVTHYSGSLKLAELARMQSTELSETELDELQKQFERAGLKSEKIDLWVDDDDLLVKKSESAKSGEGNRSDFSSTVYYSDYGTEVSVEEPPAQDTVAFSDLL